MPWLYRNVSYRVAAFQGGIERIRPDGVERNYQEASMRTLNTELDSS